VTEETAEIQATRFLCQLYLCPRVAKRIVRQWMRQYVPLPVYTGVPRPRYDTPGHWIGAMVARVLMPPTDLEMTGFYDMTHSVDSVRGSPQYIMSAWTPVTDYAFSMPVSATLDRRPELLEENMARLALYLNPDAHWHTCIDSPAMHGHAYFAQFKHVALMKRMYFPTLYVLEVLRFYIKRMLHCVPSDVQGDACDFVIDMVRPLKDYVDAPPLITPDQYQTALSEEEVKDVLEGIQRDTDQRQLLSQIYKPLLEEATGRDLVACYEILKQARHAIHEHVAALYAEHAQQLDRRMHPLDARVQLQLQGGG